MPRKIRNKSLDNRTSRLKLKIRGKPYPGIKLEANWTLGYRRLASVDGTWCVAHYLGAGKYETSTLDGRADDYNDADGVAVLTFFQAQEAARKLIAQAKLAEGTGPLTVADVVRLYPGSPDTQARLEAMVTPELGAVRCDRPEQSGCAGL
jgi:hypothetical protein